MRTHLSADHAADQPRPPPIRRTRRIPSREALPQTVRQETDRCIDRCRAQVVQSEFPSAAIPAAANWSASPPSLLEHSQDGDGEHGLVVGLDSLLGLAERSGVDLASRRTTSAFRLRPGSSARLESDEESQDLDTCGGHLMRHRRVVTGRDDHGKSVLKSDTELEPATVALIPGMEFRTVWGTDATPTLSNDGSVPAAKTVFPPPGGLRFTLITLPVDASSPSEGLDMPTAL